VWLFRGGVVGRKISWRDACLMLPYRTTTTMRKVKLPKPQLFTRSPANASMFHFVECHDHNHRSH
jgi:hypothetical protein